MTDMSTTYRKLHDPLEQFFAAIADELRRPVIMLLVGLVFFDGIAAGLFIAGVR